MTSANKYQWLIDRAELPDFLAWARDHVVEDPSEETPLKYLQIAYTADSTGSIERAVSCENPPWRGYVAKCMHWIGISKVGRKHYTWHCKIV